MQAIADQRLEEMRADFAEVMGRPFEHFHCPILDTDEEAELCRGHIVNQAFTRSTRWTVQRADVDSFYGRAFEADFVGIQYRGRPYEEILTDKEMSRHLRPTIRAGGKTVGYYQLRGALPKGHSPLVVETKSGRVELALKMTPDETLAVGEQDWQVEVTRDLRIPAFVSLLKAAHLTAFDMLGYRYALSTGGRYLGKDTLGKFFLENARASRQDAQARAILGFREFRHAVRPMLGNTDRFAGTINDGQLFVCKQGDVVWGVILLIRAAQTLHAVLMPIFEGADAGARYVKFLQSPYEQLQVQYGKFEDEAWKVHPRSTTLKWPSIEDSYPDE